MLDELLTLMRARTGHFQFESGHHGSLWLELDELFSRPRELEPFVAALAARLSAYDVEVVCGPEIGGAILAEMLAAELRCSCVIAERRAPAQSHGPNQAKGAVAYQIQSAVQRTLRNKRTAAVDDVINAGSAMTAALDELTKCGASLAAIGALLALGHGAACLAAARNVPLVTLAHCSGDLWLPQNCPRCAAGYPLENRN